MTLIFLCTSLLGEMIQDETNILKKAKKEARKALEKEVSNEKIIEIYKLNWPVKAVLSRASAEELVDKNATAIVDKNSPLLDYAHFHAQANKYYEPYQVNTEIQITLKNALGRNPRIKGRYYGLDSYGLIKIGTQRIPVIDLTKRDQIRFFPEKGKQLIADYAESLEDQYLIKRKTAIENQKNILRKRVYSENGISFFKGRYIPTPTLISQLKKMRIEKSLPARTQVLAADLFVENGFVSQGEQWSHPALQVSTPHFDYKPRKVELTSLEDIMKKMNVSFSSSPLAQHPGAKYYDFEF